MPSKVLLITPPFTQLNTPYPATAYLKGFLDEKNIATQQCDLSIELFTSIFTKSFLTQIFNEALELQSILFLEIWKQKKQYINVVDFVISFLQNQTIAGATIIIDDNFLPKGHRLSKLDLAANLTYDKLDVIDKAKHISTLFIEELGDFITANVDEFFAFTKYAEQIATSASSFDKIDDFLNYEPTLIEYQLLDLLDDKLQKHQPHLVCFTVPFPGNLFAALRCSQHIKCNYPNIKIALGGGYCNTELRSITDNRIFNYIDFITLDDGEVPLLKLTQYLSLKIDANQLERTFLLENNKVVFKNKLPNTIVHHGELPCPSYSGLLLQSYLSFLDVINPMHRLWSDGRWNKLTVSHGCYWKQCSFCDVHLDYIGNYQNTSAKKLVDKIEKLIIETGFNGFHFVDEAAPPKSLKAIAKELLYRDLKVKWWTNIRFEKTFDLDLCDLLSKSGCIAVTGGLEVASDRLLKKMNKGVDIAQVARVTHAFNQSGILVHAYLMYGFPTETEQETIDSLEVVRQLFKNNCIQSAFWHQFTTTIHSPIGKNPEEYNIKITGPKFKGFAQNDLWHQDSEGCNHKAYTKGLNLALNNYLNGVGVEQSLQSYFDFCIVNTTLNTSFIEGVI